MQMRWAHMSEGALSYVEADIQFATLKIDLAIITLSTPFFFYFRDGKLQD